MKATRLKCLASVIAGQSPPSEEVVDLEAGMVPFLQGNAEFGPEHPQPRFACESAAKHALRGDVLLSVRAPVGALNVADRRYAIGRGLVAIRAKPDMHPRYLWWVLQGLLDGIRAFANGSTYEAVTADDIESAGLPIWPLASQQRIGEFLDAETARIDTLISKRQRMVGLLEEQMWAGLNESLRDESAALAPVQLRRVLTRITDGPFGSNLKSEHYIATGARVVRLGNIGKAEFKNEDQAFVSQEHFEGLRRHAVAPGDLLIAGLGDRANHVGRACVAPALGPAMVKADCYCARVDRSHALPEFVALWLSSPSGEAAVAGASRGSTRTRINVDVAKATLIPLVPLERQRMIVTTWERERQRLRVMTSKITRQIALLKERRQALITAAVTGELDVTMGAA